MADRVWRLPADVHAACCGEDLVLLDVARDQYFCLPQAGRSLGLDPIGGELIGLARELAEDLRDAGLLTEHPEPAIRRWASPPARDTETLGEGRAASGSLMGSLLVANLAMLWRYRAQPFAALIHRASAARRGGRTDLAAAVQVAGAFQASLPWCPVQGACLFQSFLLLDLLRQRGLAADWVFAVRTWPFLAHCWVQVEDVVLNDTVDHVTSYDPILVV